MVYLARALELRDGDRGALEALTRGKTSTATVALRARTVLLAADGMPNIQIEQITGFSAPTVLKWRNRYAEGGIEALSDVQRPGREREIDELALIAASDEIRRVQLGKRVIGLGRMAKDLVKRGLCPGASVAFARNMI